MKKRKANLKWTPVGNVCAYCRRGIGSEVRIRCAECGPKTLPPGVAAPLHFCVECFSAGVEVFGHSASHKYSVIENASIYPLSKEWTADEELRLLEGVNKFGYGNWVDVAEHVGGGKTRDRAKRHYEKFFLLNAELDLSQPARPGTPPVAEEKTTVHVAGAGAPQTSGAPAAAEAPAPAEGAAPAAGGPAAEKAKEAKAAGYLPLRREFDVEWDNDAELLVMDVEFVDGEPADERALKLELLKAYNTTLDERERRRDFVVAGGGLQAARDPHEIERQRQRRGQSKYTGVQQQDERALRSAMRPYAHFQNAETHEQLVRDTQEEAALRRHVAQLRARARRGRRPRGRRRHRRRRRRLRRRRRPRARARVAAAAVTRRGAVQRGARALRAAARRRQAHAPRPRPPRPALPGARRRAAAADARPAARRPRLPPLRRRAAGGAGSVEF